MRRVHLLRTGNRVRLLEEAAENYPAWLEAIDAARQTINFEMYIIHADGFVLYGERRRHGTEGRKE